MDESDATSSVKSSVPSSNKSIQLRRNEGSKSFDAGEIRDYNPMSLVMLAIKDPQQVASQLLRLPIKQFFRNGIRYRTLINVMICFFVLFLLQLRYSAKTRGWTRSIAQAIIFGITFFGLFFTFLVAGIKFRLHQKHRAKLITSSDSQQATVTE